MANKAAFPKDIQYYKFCLYGFFKNLRFFEPFFILFLTEKGLDYTQIGLLYTIREIGRYLTEVPSGIAADVVGRKKTMVLSFSFYIISFLVFYQASSYWLFIVAMIVYSFGDAFRTGTHKAMIFDYLLLHGLSRFKTDYYGHTRSWSQLGSALSAILAAVIVIFGKQYSIVFLFSTIPYVLDLLLIVSYPKVLDGEIKNKSWADVGRSFREVIKIFYVSFSNIRILKAVVNISSFSGYYATLKDFLQPVLKTFALSLPILVAFNNEKQRSALAIGIVYSLIYVMSSVASRNAGTISRRFATIKTALNVLLLAGIISGIISGVLYHYNLLIPAILFYLTIFIIENMRKPMGVSYISDQFDQKVMASALSANSQVQTIFAAILPVMLGFLADTFSLGWAIVGISGMMLILALQVKINQ